MGGVTRTIRLLVGLGMIGAGVTLVAPAGLSLAERIQTGPQPDEPLGPLPPPAPRVAPLASQQPSPSATGLPLHHEQPAGEERPAPAVVRDSTRPPPPPTRLPPVAPAARQAGPGLQAAYRSTLDVPPPPLLDGQRPPPLAVGWTRRTTPPQPTGGVRQATEPQAPSMWRVRDGDDLNGIATRVYGTPLAAAAIWEANRRLMPDPRLLPIGIEIVLPPPAAIWPAPGGQASIEPAPSGPPPVRPGRDDPAAAWLPSGTGPATGGRGG